MTVDPHRPIFHFLPPANWMNDPNGLIQWQGTYHMFYQYNPHGAFHGHIHWGHAISRDLVHWQHLPVALAPSPATPDEDGCWSGCAVDDHGVPTLIYSGNSAGAQHACLATSADGLLTWEKYAANPVIAAPPGELSVSDFRDHSVWREGETWYQLMGAGITGQGGAALLYRSPDLRRWEYLHPLLVGDARRTDPVWTGTLWECPDLFALDGRHVLIIGVWDRQPHSTVAIVGDYRAGRLTPQVEHKLDWGDHYFYAPQSFRDDRGRRVVFGWLPEGRSPEAQLASGWSGVMSLPRVLGLGPNGHVRMTPAPELAALRADHLRHEPATLAAGQLREVGAGDALELVLALHPAADGSCGLVLRRSPDGAEQTLVSYDAARGQLTVDRRQASLDPSVDSNAHVAPLPLAAGEPLRLHVFLDRSVLEIFANEQLSLSTRIYPTRADSLGVALFATGGAAELAFLDIWRMRDIWAGSQDQPSDEGGSGDGQRQSIVNP